MRQISTSLCAAVALSFALGSAAPAMAAPVLAPTAPAASSDVVQIQSRRHRDDRRDRFERRGNRAYYNGHRGYRDRRPGYRQHNGWWFPPAAFIAGAIIGGGLANQQPQRLSRQHVRWCQERWRSYRVSDNSYQPLNGPRRACVSPYS
jgi:hypothetical protein